MSAEIRNLQQHIPKRANVGGRLIPVALQQGEPPHAAEQLIGIAVGQRRDSKRDVAKHLDVDPTQPERDERTKGGILRQAHERFSTARRHGLNENAIKVSAELRVCNPAQLGVCASDVFLVCEMKAHATDLSLVHRFGRYELCDHREAEHARKSRRVVGGVR